MNFVDTKSTLDDILCLRRKVNPWGRNCVVTDAAGVTVVWWQVGVCVSRWGLGDASCWWWCLVSSQWSPRVSAATCEPRPGPATASPEPQHFHITALLQQPPAHNLSHLHIKPNITGTLSARLGLSGAERLWCASDSCSLQILVFVTLPGPIQKKIVESEPSSQEEVKLFMVEDKNFMAPIMINYCLILNIIRGNRFNFTIFLSVLLLNSIKKEPVALSDF